MNKKKSLLVFLAATVLFIYLKRDNYEIVNFPPQGKNIIAFGDSLTLGIGGEGSSYPEILAKELNIKIMNQGVSGNTSSDALKRLKYAVLDNDPKYVLLLLGGNDILKRKSKKKLFKNLKEMILRIQEKGAIAILIGIQFPIFASYGNDYYNLAKETNSPYIPNILGGILIDPDLMSDQVHPNQKGYKAMANKIKPTLQRFLSKH